MVENQKKGENSDDSDIRVIRVSQQCGSVVVLLTNLYEWVFPGTSAKIKRTREQV